MLRLKIDVGDCGEEEFLESVVRCPVVVELLGLDGVLTDEISNLSVRRIAGNGGVEAWVGRLVEGDEGAGGIPGRRDSEDEMT